MIRIQDNTHNHFAFRPVPHCRPLGRDGLPRRRAHQCAVIISDSATSDHTPPKSTVCKLNCELGK